ncbi:hypothetical protein V5O48_017627 [Marasmius crinis-equi]|uniref:Uncharacterized protein n=1 Tax=Marasmius crinis-equi TaxID=585013 RepID=A0ABR3ENK3_9AGAR
MAIENKSTPTQDKNQTLADTLSRFPSYDLTCTHLAPGDSRMTRYQRDILEMTDGHTDGELLEMEWAQLLEKQGREALEKESQKGSS